MCFQGSRSPREKLKAQSGPYVPFNRVKTLDEWINCETQRYRAACCLKEGINKTLRLSHHDVKNIKCKAHYDFLIHGSTRIVISTLLNETYVEVTPVGYSRGPALCLLSQPHLDTTPHTVNSVEWALSLWYISRLCTPACASFPFHKCDRLCPCKAPLLFFLPTYTNQARQSPDRYKCVALAD